MSRVRAKRGVCIGPSRHLKPGEVADLDAGTVTFLVSIGAVEEIPEQTPKPEPEMSDKPSDSNEPGANSPAPDSNETGANQAGLLDAGNSPAPDSDPTKRSSAKAGKKGG
jgi:hypothetical protein